MDCWLPLPPSERALWAQLERHWCIYFPQITFQFVIVDIIMLNSSPGQIAAPKPFIFNQKPKITLCVVSGYDPSVLLAGHGDFLWGMGHINLKQISFSHRSMVTASVILKR